MENVLIGTLGAIFGGGTTITAYFAFRSKKAEADASVEIAKIESKSPLEVLETEKKELEIAQKSLLKIISETTKINEEMMKEVDNLRHRVDFLEKKEKEWEMERTLFLRRIDFLEKKVAK